MIRKAKIKYLIENHKSDWVKTRMQVFDRLSEEQAVFCICGKLATGLHERNCKKFNDLVDKVTVEKLWTKYHYNS